MGKLAINYEPTDWKNLIVDEDGTVVQKGTPLSAENLNNIERGIKKADNAVHEIQETLNETVQNLENTEQKAEQASQAISSIQNNIAQPNGLATLGSDGIITSSQLPSNLREMRVVPDIAARDKLETFESLRVLVLDATADPTVESGWAEYAFDGQAYVKVGEGESLDITLSWADIQNKPIVFPPSAHGHTESEITDLDKYTQQEVDSLLTAIRKLLTDHEGNTTNPHHVTKKQVGLENVQDYGVASQTDAETGTSNNTYLTPLRAMQLVAKWAQNNLASAENDGLMSATDYANLINAVRDVATAMAHIESKSNPHAVTKAQVGLSSVQNYAIASQANAEAGTSNALYMTPLRVKNAIDKFVPKAISGFTNDANFVSSNASNITVSTTAPTNPSVNDIWIKT